MKEFISCEDLQNFSAAFDLDPRSQVAMDAVVENGIIASARNSAAAAKYLHAYSVNVESGDVCNQKQSGRCWMFASLNVFRLEVMKKLNLKNMELSQSYPLFWDKLEKSNYFLENILDTLDEPLDGRVVAYLLTDPVGDGGQWDMFRSLVAKYGVVPKDVYPESNVSSSTRELKKYLTTKLREFACTLRTAHEAGKGMDELRAMKDQMMETVYRMLTICLGKPPVKFTWETKDKDEKFIRIADITPQEFYEQYVGFDLDEYVTVINAPTKDKPYGKTFTVQCLGSVRGGKYPVKYLNLPIEELKRLTIDQLKNGEVVWFGSDVGQFSDRAKGILATDSLKLEQLFSTLFPLTKEQRLNYGESLMTHAMVITGVNLVTDENGNETPNRWRVENSWGDEHGDKGYFTMSDEWFSEFVYQILLNRKYFTAEESAQFDAEPIELKPWDPMGSLAF
ncbi:MAG: C1 family peptidase [Lachnospiraceae bacterium]|nr:C1 family peptidase [Lachnospiraceae bacterium]